MPARYRRRLRRRRPLRRWKRTSRRKTTGWGGRRRMWGARRLYGRARRFRTRRSSSRRPTLAKLSLAIANKIFPKIRTDSYVSGQFQSPNLDSMTFVTIDRGYTPTEIQGCFDVVVDQKTATYDEVPGKVHITGFRQLTQVTNQFLGRVNYEVWSFKAKDDIAKRENGVLDLIIQMFLSDPPPTNTSWSTSSYLTMGWRPTNCMGMHQFFKMRRVKKGTLLAGQSFKLSTVVKKRYTFGAPKYRSAYGGSSVYTAYRGQRFWFVLAWGPSMVDTNTLPDPDYTTSSYGPVQLSVNITERYEILNADFGLNQQGYYRGPGAIVHPNNAATWHPSVAQQIKSWDQTGAFVGTKEPDPANRRLP